MTPEQRIVLETLLVNHEHAARCAGMMRLPDTMALDKSRSAIGSFCSTLPSAPPWTSEAPTVAGDYRWRIDGVVKLCLITHSDWRPGELAAWLPGDEADYPPEDMGGQWSGPLPEPPA